MGQVRIIDPSSFAHGLSTAAAVSPDWTEDYTTYTSTANYLNDPNDWYINFGGSGGMAIDTSETFEGHQTLRYDFSGREGEGSPCADTTRKSSARPDLTLSKTITEFWLETYVKFEDHFDAGVYNRTACEVDDASGFSAVENISFSGGGSAQLLDVASIPGGGDLMRFRALTGSTPASGETVTGDTSGGSASVQSSDQGCDDPPDYKMVLYSARNGSDNPVGRYNFNGLNQPARGWTVAGAQTCTSYRSTNQVTGDDSVDTVEAQFQLDSPTDMLSIVDGTWHRLRLYAKVPTSSCDADGELAFWQDDTLGVDAVNLETDARYMHQLDIGANINGPMADQSLWIGHVKMWVNGNDPGWSRF